MENASQFLLIIFFLSGITNGIFFTPPSELAIWLAVSSTGLGFKFHLFILGNFLGHVSLFFIFRKYSEKLENFIFSRLSWTWINRFKNRYVASISWLHEPSGYYLVYGRLLPFFHTFTSIVAAKNRVDFLKFSLLTLGGDYLFGVLIYFHYTVLSKFLSQMGYLIALLFTFSLIHWLIKKRIKGQ